jgi:hypothetical protein
MQTLSPKQLGENLLFFSLCPQAVLCVLKPFSVSSVFQLFSVFQISRRSPRLGGKGFCL